MLLGLKRILRCHPIKFLGGRSGFDPAINYGPNDAGVSALTIAIAVVGILLGSWIFGALYALIANYIKGKGGKDKKGNEIYRHLLLHIAFNPTLR